MSDTQKVEATIAIDDESFNRLAEETYGYTPIDITDSTEHCDPHAFIRELQELCVKHNMTIFAGALGLRFIPKDQNGVNIVDTENIAGVYFTQAFSTKEFIPVN